MTTTSQQPPPGGFLIAMIKDLIASIFRKPSAEQLVKEALEEYQRQLINAEATAAYQIKMVEYYRDGIKRLQQKQFYST
jgi:hypothetical protein